MRDLINILTESVGLANRRPGDRFANDQGDEVIFADLNFFPEDGAYESDEELQSAIAAFARKIGVPPQNIVWINAPRGARGFGMAHFVDNENQDFYIGKYFRSINPNRNENYFPNDLPGGFRLQSKVAQKERFGYKPSDVLTKFDDLTPEDILNQIRAKFGADSDESRATELFMAADRFPVTIPLGNMNFDAFTNYFCEMFQPMALVMGKPTRGNAAEAESKFLTDGGYTSCTINFGTSKTGGLVDSKLINPAGQSIGLSSKAKAGAKASAKNLKEKVDEMRGTEEGRKLLEKYKTEVSVLEMIVDGGYDHGPLNLAMSFDMITPEDKQQVLSLKKLGLKDFRPDMLSDTLQNFWNQRRADDPSKISPFYHMLAAIAYPVADYINKNTRFSQAGSDILNFGAFMQAYTYASRSGDNIILKEFEVKYPSTAVTDVLLSASKTYYSTGNKGNYTFQILKNGATMKDIEVADAQVDTKPDVDLDKITQARSGVTARGKGIERDQPEEKSLGRRRRK